LKNEKENAGRKMRKDQERKKFLFFTEERKRPRESEIKGRDTKCLGKYN
jgi:hypothetical protein